MKIVCRDCGRITPTKSVPYHCVCGCRRILICLGEQKNCELIEDGKRFPENKYKHENVYKINYPEKARYFKEKYPTKH